MRLRPERKREQNRQPIKHLSSRRADAVDVQRPLIVESRVPNETTMRTKKYDRLDPQLKPEVVVQPVCEDRPANAHEDDAEPVYGGAVFYQPELKSEDQGEGGEEGGCGDGLVEVV